MARPTNGSLFHTKISTPDSTLFTENVFSRITVNNGGFVCGKKEKPLQGVENFFIQRAITFLPVWENVRRVQKSAKCDYLLSSVRHSLGLSFCFFFIMQQLGYHWTDFNEIWYVRIIWKPVDKIRNFILILWQFMFTNLMHKFFISIYLLHSCTCFEQYYAHLQEDNCNSAASVIVTVFSWLFSTQVTTVLS